ncbi:hypothetical protein ACWC4B_45095, partial [Streptomyces sp. NPDC001340]
ETSNTSPNGTGASCVAHPVGVTRLVAVLKTLNDRLHELHSQANYPSMRSLARVMGVSPTTLSDSMTKSKLPSKDTAVRLALAFAERFRWDADVDLDEQQDRIDREVAMLWERARQEAEPPDQDRVAEAVRETWEDFAGVAWPRPGYYGEVMEAMNHATFGGGKVSIGGWVNLFVTVHDVDTYFVLNGEGEEVSGHDWLQEFTMVLSRRLGIIVDVLLQIGEDFDWPETDGAGVIIR